MCSRSNRDWVSIDGFATVLTRDNKPFATLMLGVPSSLWRPEPELRGDEMGTARQAREQDSDDQSGQSHALAPLDEDVKPRAKPKGEDEDRASPKKEADVKRQ